jgi:hypothetical protein
MLLSDGVSYVDAYAALQAASNRLERRESLSHAQGFRQAHQDAGNVPDTGACAAKVWIIGVK